MFRRSSSVSAAMCALALSGTVAVSSASAAPFVFGLTGSSGTSGVDGNARTFSATQGGTTINVRVTGWSLSSPTSGGIVQDSFLGAYSSGLGVTSGDETGAGNTHIADNQNRYDFFIFQFDRAVQLESGTFTPFTIGNGPDTDATVGFGTTNLAWNAQPALNNQSFATLSGLFNGGYSTLTGGGSTNTRMLNPAANSGNIWLVGAAFNNADGKIDGFKFKDLSVNSAVPEPATWAMMIIGFGMVGSAMRRRTVKTNVSFA